MNYKIRLSNRYWKGPWLIEFLQVIFGNIIFKTTIGRAALYLFILLTQHHQCGVLVCVFFLGRMVMVNFSGSQSIHHRFRTEKLRSLNEFAKIVEYRLDSSEKTYFWTSSGSPSYSNFVMQKCIKIRSKWKFDDFSKLFFVTCLITSAIVKVAQTWQENYQYF